MSSTVCFYCDAEHTSHKWCEAKSRFVGKYGDIFDITLDRAKKSNSFSYDASGSVKFRDREKTESKGVDRDILRERLVTSITTAMNENPSPENIAEAVLGTLYVIKKRRDRRKDIISQAEGKPICHICNLRIFLDETGNSPAQFSLDHIVRIADGGTSDPENIKPAHALCNEIRGHTKVRLKTQRTLDIMKRYIKQRTILEETHV